MLKDNIQKKYYINLYYNLYYIKNLFKAYPFFYLLKFI